MLQTYKVYLDIGNFFLFKYKTRLWFTKRMVNTVFEEFYLYLVEIGLIFFLFFLIVSLSSTGFVIIALFEENFFF